MKNSVHNNQTKSQHLNYKKKWSSMAPINVIKNENKT